jgi:hypothetical protein
MATRFWEVVVLRRAPLQFPLTTEFRGSRHAETASFTLAGSGVSDDDNSSLNSVVLLSLCSDSYCACEHVRCPQATSTVHMQCTCSRTNRMED